MMQRDQFSNFYFFGFIHFRFFLLHFPIIKDFPMIFHLMKNSEFSVGFGNIDIAFLLWSVATMPK